MHMDSEKLHFVLDVLLGDSAALSEPVKEQLLQHCQDPEALRAALLKLPEFYKKNAGELLGYIQSENKHRAPQRIEVNCTDAKLPRIQDYRYRSRINGMRYRCRSFPAYFPELHAPEKQGPLVHRHSCLLTSLRLAAGLLLRFLIRRR